ncbi:Iron transport multicopper oxidase FET3 [Cyphellophora attinorum]|uniref:Iron transport multicopper oxidase FET3 n=1 Tax=Cyphellophora attinorum TaxID=1664694 RepID=A0A0N1HCK6_9EURO|nr:Iron transport multicopper oxidase FET3 [Phialophora attinorum]KPI42463.1 Iron transport multicopper oxidase FET3 [Phialophora attinorum]
MALSLSNFLYSIALLTSIVAAETRTYDFDIGWVRRNPDGQQERSVVGINGQWPIPRIEANVGDVVVVNAKNSLGNRTDSIHFHGLYQNGTTHMDGAGSVSQCPIPSGSTFTYNFTVDQPGTYWYHSHVDGQYPDGLRGPLIVHDPENPFKDQYDEELVLTLSDWYHDEMPDLLSGFLSVTNPTGAEPVPNSALMNDTQNATISVQPGKTYFLRIINMAAFAPQYFWIEGHSFKIIEVDGIYTEATEADQLHISAAQRYGVLLTTKNTTNENFAIVGSMDTDLFDAIPDGLNPNEITEFEPFDDFYLVPQDKEELLPEPDMQIQLDVVMDNLNNGFNYAFFNNLTWTKPVVPTLYTVLSAPPSMLNEARIYGSNTNTFVLPHMSVVEMIVNNHDPGKHPFHLHGHAFQTIIRSDEEAGDYDPNNATDRDFPATPMRRDTVLMRPNGHLVLRFRADNPGVWIFHCHIEWHVSSGLIMTFVEAPEQLRANLSASHTVPQDHFDACNALSPPVPTYGNAAGHGAASSEEQVLGARDIDEDDWLNFEGENVQAPPLPSGFTARGIVALVFSCICGILGCLVIAWYGLGEMGSVALAREQRKIDQLEQDSQSMGSTQGSNEKSGHGTQVLRHVMGK